MRPVFAVLGFIALGHLGAQVGIGFADSTSTWYVADTHPHGSPEDPSFVETTTRRYLHIGDTLIDGAQWNKLFSMSAVASDTIFEGAVRQSDAIVEFIDIAGTLDTLYDFQMDINDSVQYSLDFQEVWLPVVGIDSVLVNGAYHRMIEFAEYIGPPASLRERWIAGIGSIHGPLFPARPVAFATEWPDSVMLTCFGQNDSVLWAHPNYSTCEVNILLDVEDHASAALVLFPVPGSAHFTINPDPQQVMTLSVFDAVGHITLTNKVIIGTTTIDTSAWPQGVFHVILRSQVGFVQVGQWIKL